jgi:hypothetical protein
VLAFVRESWARSVTAGFDWSRSPPPCRARRRRWRWQVDPPRRRSGDLRRRHDLAGLPVAALGLVDPVHRAAGPDAGGVAVDVGHLLVAERATHDPSLDQSVRIARLERPRKAEGISRRQRRACAPSTGSAILLDHAPQARRARAPRRVRLRPRDRRDGADASAAPTRSAAALLRRDALPDLHVQRAAPWLLLAPQGRLRLRVGVMQRLSRGRPPPGATPAPCWMADQLPLPVAPGRAQRGRSKSARSESRS